MPSSARTTIEKWNRKLHFYLGLYFIFFLWLFLLTGLMLNHGDWRIARAAVQRRDPAYERLLTPPAGGTDIDRARDVMRQLNFTGEPDVVSSAPGSFAFHVARPKDAFQVKVDLTTGRASVDQFANSPLAAFRIFHTFNGSKYNQPDTHRDWMMTTMWVITMDALAIGLILMVLGSYYMWFRLKRTHRLGWIVLGSGVAMCAVFLVGLAE